MTLSLHEKALFFVKNYKLSEKELILVLEQIDKDKTYLAFGKPSLWRYCVETLGLTESETYRFIGVSRAAALIPQFKEAIQSGALSVGKAARITSVLTEDNHESWINLAQTATHREIEREIKKENPSSLPKEKIKALTASKSELRLVISVELENKLKKAQDISGSKNLEETFEKIVEFYLKHKDKLAKAERLKDKKTILHPSSLSYADTSVQSNPARTIPRALLHQVFLRDKGKCTFKNCGETKWVQIHHIKPYSHGGKHELSNLTTLCSAHHKMLHQHTSPRPRAQHSSQ